MTEIVDIPTPTTREMVHVVINGRYNGSGRVRRDQDKVFIMEYSGIFPSLDRDDTDRMLYDLEGSLHRGMTNGKFEQRKRHITWNTSVKKEDF